MTKISEQIKKNKEGSLPIQSPCFKEDCYRTEKVKGTYSEFSRQSSIKKKAVKISKLTAEDKTPVQKPKINLDQPPKVKQTRLMKNPKYEQATFETVRYADEQISI